MINYIYDGGKTLEVYVGKVHWNLGVADNILFADSNDSINWNRIRIELPKGKWRVMSKSGDYKVVILIKEEKY